MTRVARETVEDAAGDPLSFAVKGSGYIQSLCVAALASGSSHTAAQVSHIYVWSRRRQTRSDFNAVARRHEQQRNGQRQVMMLGAQLWPPPPSPTGENEYGTSCGAATLSRFGVSSCQCCIIAPPRIQEHFSNSPCCLTLCTAHHQLNSINSTALKFDAVLCAWCD